MGGEGSGVGRVIWGMRMISGFVDFGETARGRWREGGKVDGFVVWAGRGGGRRRRSR